MLTWGYCLCLSRTPGFQTILYLMRVTVYLKENLKNRNIETKNEWQPRNFNEQSTLMITIPQASGFTNPDKISPSRESATMWRKNEAEMLVRKSEAEMAKKRGGDAGQKDQGERAGRGQIGGKQAPRGKTSSDENWVPPRSKIRDPSPRPAIGNCGHKPK